MMTTELYSADFAPLYDVLHADLTEDIPFWLALAKKTADPILEVGCGTGRLLLPLAQAGHRITGIDTSPAMLALAQTQIDALNLGERAHCVQADITKTAPLDLRYQLAFFGHNTLYHFPLNRLQGVFRQLRTVVAPSGTLCIDLVNPYLIMELEDEEEYQLEQMLVHPTTEEKIDQFVRYTNDIFDQCWRVEWKFVPKSGREPFVVKTTYHYFYPHQLETIMSANGFRWEAIYGEYDLSEYNEESNSLIVVAKRI